jgi:hypothetical protein
MNRVLRLLIMAVLGCTLLSTAVAGGSYGGFSGGRLASMAAAEGSWADPSPVYTVEQVPIAGEGYHLNVASWQVSGASSGGSYHLEGPAAPELRGSGCCCTFLPLTLRGSP